MFVDIAKIKIKAGDGGNGAVAFRREKYVAAGGPDGGDGGRGGNVVFKVNDNLSTLADFRYKRKYRAPNGDPGQAGHRNGRKGEDLIIEVPRGTIIREVQSGKVMADMSDDDEFIAAKGGRGGWGNSHFATPTRQTPRFSKPGVPGEEWEVSLELKLLADVGLLGFPNVGKSTLISVVSQAKPIIADYHFTTLTPVLGVISMGEGNSFVMADIPGLIEGASDGVGLGHEFLRHVERCRLLVHIIDAAGSEGRDPIDDFNKINAELVKFNPDMADLPQIVVGNKIDLATDEQLEKLEKYFTENGYQYFTMCAPIVEGTQEVINAVAAKLATLPPIKRYEKEEIPAEFFEKSSDGKFTITVEDDVYSVEGEWLLKILQRTNLDDYESLQYFQR
ncbi:MAG: GTPase ObgE, partial [Clostridia bacterium]|nr:GTPase ObgE [Clostridia bacterium]